MWSVVEGEIPLPRVVRLSSVHRPMAACSPSLLTDDPGFEAFSRAETTTRLEPTESAMTGARVVPED